MSIRAILAFSWGYKTFFHVQLSYEIFSGNKLKKKSIIREFSCSAMFSKKEFAIVSYLV